MKALKLIIALYALLIAASCSSTKTDQNGGSSFKFDTTTLKTGEEYYQCPMHPAVLSAKPGDCPDCGMALEKVAKQ